PVGLRGRAGRGGFISNRPVESASVFEQIDLRGILPNGYEVELYRNGVLVGSIANAVNGQYEFLEVPVDYGLNVFRLVFFGPQGQRREEVRRITVGDGRLAKGDLEYEVGVIQRDVNLLEVQGPNFNPTEGFGNWQGAAQFSYGVTSDITAISSVSYFENDGANDFVGTAGIRTGIGSLAVRADAAASDKGGFALGVGTGGRALGGSFTLSHFEYDGGFIDEIRSNSRDMLQRATEFDFNTNLNFGSELKRKSVPIAARLRHIEFADGRTDTDAVLRGSYRLPGMIVSNTLEYSRDTGLDGSGFSQLIGNFDLATFRRSRTQIRGSVGYTVTQGPDITNVEAGVDYQLDDRTVVSGQAGYSFNGGGLNLGASAIREFDRFSIALDGNYGFEQQNYSVALRLGFSFGRDPLSRRFFLDRPGQASSGASSVRAFQDMNGDRVFNDGDVPLDGVDFIASNNTFTTDQNGMARLTQIGNGNRASIQVDPSTFPDILMAPVERGVEIVPRAGRFHVMDFPIVALSEVEGTVTFKGEENDRGVSGLRLQLLDVSGKVAATVRSERDGYFFFEQIKPGAYTLRIEPKQAQQLGICLASDPAVNVEPQGGIYSVDALVYACEDKD
ncbi:MAG: carboxypeptidase-like regulatory domain-containing protein, partial [Pseudomonadota bacterium]